MGAVMEEEIKRWTARRKSALVLEIIQGKTPASEARRQFDLPPAEIESWVEDGKRGMGKRPAHQARGRARAVRAPAQGTAGGLRLGDAGASRRKKNAVPAGEGRVMIEAMQSGRD